MNADTYRTKLTRHIQSRIARELQVGRAHVCLVAKGLRTSARVEAALAKEYARVDREVVRYQRQLERKRIAA